MSNRRRRRNVITFLAVIRSSIIVANFGAANLKNFGAKCSIQCTRDICTLLMLKSANLRNDDKSSIFDFRIQK